MSLDYLARLVRNLLEYFRARLPDNYATRMESRMGIRPGLKATHASIDCRRIHRPTNQTVLAFQYRREGGFIVALRFRFQAIKVFQSFTDILLFRRLVVPPEHLPDLDVSAVEKITGAHAA